MKTLALLVAALALVACGDDSTTPSEAGTSAAVSEVLGQSDDRGILDGGDVRRPRVDCRSPARGRLAGRQHRVADQGGDGWSRATLEKAGAGFDTVVMTNVYLADFDDWTAFNETYKRCFEDRLPPRVTVEVSSLAFGRIEISMVAQVRDD